MAWLFIIALLCGGSPVAGAVLSRPLKARERLLWMMALLAMLGGVIGLYCSFWVRWQPAPTLRYVGFPFPAMIWQLEKGQWVDYVGTPLTAAMNIGLFAGSGAFLALCWMVFLRFRLTQKLGRDQKGPSIAGAGRSDVFDGNRES